MKGIFVITIIFKKFCSLPHPDQNEIIEIEEELDRQSLKSAIENNGNYYVNKMNQLYEFMDSGNSISIFRPRRMGKSTMINDIAFLYKKGKHFPY